MTTTTEAAETLSGSSPKLVDAVKRIHVPANFVSDGYVTYNSGDRTIAGVSDWHMQAWVTADTGSGELTGFCRSWTTNGGNPFGAGFHGGLMINFADAQGNLVYYLQPQRYGVCGGWDMTGPHDRQDSVNGQIDPAKAARVAQIVIALAEDPEAKWLGTMESQLAQSLEQSIEGVVQVAETAFGAILTWLQGSI